MTKPINEIANIVFKRFGDLFKAIERDALHSEMPFIDYLSTEGEPIELMRSLIMTTSDRDNLKQDFTSQSLAYFLAGISVTGKERKILDICAGSGALTYQASLLNPSAEYTCIEYDEKMIYALIIVFKLLKLTGFVIRFDVLKREFKQAYSIKNGILQQPLLSYDLPNDFDLAISNPPFNIDNSAFLKFSLDYSEKASFIFCNSVLDDKKFNLKQVINKLILCPDKMFDKTDIPTIIFTMSKKPDELIGFFDLNNDYSTKTVTELNRGTDEKDASHYNRLYSKKRKVLKPEVVDFVRNANTNTTNFCSFVKRNEVESLRNNIKYSEDPLDSFRDIKQAVEELRNVIELQESIQLILNTSFLKNVIPKGINIEDFLKQKKQSEEINKNFKELNDCNPGLNLPKLGEHQTVIETKSNEICFKFKRFSNNTLFAFPPMLIQILPLFVNYIYTLNHLENAALSKVRNTLLPYLMNGTLKVVKD